MTNSIAYLLNNSKKSLEQSTMAAHRLRLPGQLLVRCLLPLPAASTNTAQPAYTNTLHRRTTINVLCLIKDSNELITME